MAGGVHQYTLTILANAVYVNTWGGNDGAEKSISTQDYDPRALRPEAVTSRGSSLN